MTDSLWRVRPRVALAPLQRRDLEAARELCASRPAAYVMPAQQLERIAQGSAATTGRLWALHSRSTGRRELVGVVWDGVNLVPAVPDPTGEVLSGLAEGIGTRLTRPSGIVGEAEVVLDLWTRVRGQWGPARAVREEQWLMVLDRPPVFPTPSPAGVSGIDLEPVRASRPEDYDALLPAAVHMFTQEVGYDPTLSGRGVYEERLQRLIRHGRSFVQFGAKGSAFEKKVVFKAEVGVLGGGVAEIQGVWVEPSLRGRGLGREGIASACEWIRVHSASVVSLYVNSYNTTAVAAYEAVGFRRIGTFATVML